MPEAIFKIIFYYGGDRGWEERKKESFLLSKLAERL